MARTKIGDDERLTALYQEAVVTYGARCLWNMAPSATSAGMKQIVEQLRKYGGMDAWRLAARIKEALKDAA